MTEVNKRHYLFIIIIIYRSSLMHKPSGIGVPHGRPSVADRISRALGS